MIPAPPFDMDLVDVAILCIAAMIAMTTLLRRGANPLADPAGEPSLGRAIMVASELFAIMLIGCLVVTVRHLQ